MNAVGHNELPYRLDVLASAARRGLERVAGGEAETLDGWLAYGAALNEGRALFPGDKEFGRWLSSSKLEEDVHPADQSAAMWAAANQAEFEEAQAAGKARTIRGIHDKWKRILKDREAEEQRGRVEAERRAAEGAAESDRKTPEIPSERTNREDGAMGREGYAPDGSSRQPQADADEGGVPSEQGQGDGGTSVAAGESPAPDPEPEAEETKERRKLAKLSREGLEDEVIGLRADLADAKAEAKAMKVRLEAAKRRLAEATNSDAGRALGNAMRERDTVRGRLGELQSALKREEYRRKKAEERVAELEGTPQEL